MIPIGWMPSRERMTHNHNINMRGGTDKQPIPPILPFAMKMELSWIPTAEI